MDKFSRTLLWKLSCFFKAIGLLTSLLPLTIALVSSNVRSAINEPSKPLKTVCDLEDEQFLEALRAQEKNAIAIGISPSRLIPPPQNGIVSGLSVLKPRKPHQKLKDFAFNKDFHAGIVDIKFVEGADITLVNGVLQSGNKKLRLDQINDVIAKHGMTIKPLFSRPPEELRAEKACGERREGQELDDLTLWFELYIDPLLKSDASFGLANSVVNRINGIGEVETISYRLISGPLPFADYPPITPDYSGFQTYFSASSSVPAGMDVNYAHAIGDAGKGLGVKVIDVEGWWGGWHEDFVNAFVIKQPPKTWKGCYGDTDAIKARFLEDYDHGTGVMGIVIADDINGIGIKGISPRVQWGGVSIYGEGKPDGCPDAENVANAISVASGYLSEGDVMIVELQPCNSPVQAGPGNGNGTNIGTGLPWSCVPAEHYSAVVFAAISSATANGRILVNTAGNSDIDLDSPGFNGRFTPGHANFQDAGAIIVGARQTNGTPSSFSNYGERIDVSAWGSDIWSTVVTCSPTAVANNWCANYPTPTFPEYQIYTKIFGGTSGAAPMVAGAIASLQGLQKARGGKPLTASVLRQMVKTIGVPQNAGKKVGRMPDIRALHTWMLADTDLDGMPNIDVLLVGRRPDFDERKLIPLLLED
jgi:serine protease